MTTDPQMPMVLGKATAQAWDDGFLLENEHLRCRVDKLGQVTRKRLNLEVKIMQSNLLEDTTECVKIRILNKQT